MTQPGVPQSTYGVFTPVAIEPIPHRQGESLRTTAVTFDTNHDTAIDATKPLYTGLTGKQPLPDEEERPWEEHALWTCLTMLEEGADFTAVAWDMRKRTYVALKVRRQTGGADHPLSEQFLVEGSGDSFNPTHLQIWNPAPALVREAERPNSSLTDNLKRASGGKDYFEFKL